MASDRSIAVHPDVMRSARSMKIGSRTVMALSIAGLFGGCGGSGFLGMPAGPAIPEDRVVSMLSFEPYVNDSFLRRQRLSSCENLRTFYNQVERSIRADLPDTSSYVLDIIASNRTSLQTVSATRNWKNAGRIQATYRHTGEKTDSVEVTLWRDQRDTRPAKWYLARKGLVGTKLDALGRRALAVTCTRAATSEPTR
jgi:hypothetical protein